MPRAWLLDRVPWLRSADLRVIATLAAIGALIILFVKLGSEVAEHDVQQLDEAILLGLRASPDDPLGPRWFEHAMAHLSALGSGAVTGLVTVIALGFLILARRPAYAALVAAAALGTWLFMWLLKDLYARPRPTVVTPIDPPASLSFPSGHSMVSVALYLTLAVVLARTLPARRLRVFVIVVGALLALLIGFTRVYLGVHYPSDVLGGWAVGLCWALVCGLGARGLARRGTVETGAADRA